MTNGDAPAADVALDAPGASLCPGSFVMCEGFESGIAQNPPWSSVFSMSFDAAHVYRGAIAAHAQTPSLPADANYASALIDNTNGATLGTNTAYLRAFLYYAGGSAQTVLLAEVGPKANTPGQLVRIFVQTGELVVETDSVNTTPTGVAMPTDRWTCLELAATGSTTAVSADAHLTMWLDGVQIADRGAFDMSPSEQFVLGLNFYALPAAPASDLWIDEVVLDSARVGCMR